jgi:hypothetical protein
MGRSSEKGPTTAFSTFTPFKSWFARLYSRVVHFGAHGEDENIKPLAFLHHAFWATITPDELRTAGFRRDEAPEHGALLFVSAFNGDASTYIRGFSDDLGTEMDALWGGCQDWTTATDFHELFAFILSYRRTIDTYFNAYHSTSSEIRASMRLRSGVDMLLELSDQGDPKAFARRYLHVAQTMWGNAEESP